MLHLRVIAPEELRDSIIGVLRGEVGVANIVLPGGPRQGSPRTAHNQRV